MGGYRRFCVQCGSELKQDARFCANCGQPAAANSPQPAVTGEHDGATRDLQPPPFPPAWDASAVPPDGALLPPPGSARPPQDAPFPPPNAPFPPDGSRFPPQDVPFPPEGTRFPPEAPRFLPEASRFPADDGSGLAAARPPKPPDSFGFPPQDAPRPPGSSDATARLQNGPAAPSQGLALPSAYPAAASALPAPGPPTATGPLYPAPATGDTAQFSRNWMNDVGLRPQWEPSPAPGAGQDTGTRERPRRLLLAGLIALVAAVIVVPAVLIAHSLHGITGGSAAAQPTTKQPARNGATAAPSQRAAAASLAALLAQTATDRSSIVNAVGAVEHCTAALAQAPQVFQNAAASRQRLLQQLAGLSGRSALPAAMLQELTGAWQASAAVDTDLGKWAQDEAAGGCKPNDHANANYQASVGPDGQATNDKTAFVTSWNAIATKYGLTQYRTSQL